MSHQNNQTDLNQLAEKVIVGVSIALRKLAETAAANNETLIIGDKDGNYSSVPAKELLKKISK